MKDKRPGPGLRAAFAGLALLLLTGGTAPPLPPSFAGYDVMTADVALLPNGRFQWSDEDPQAGSLGIWVSIPRQHIYVFRGGKLVGMSTVSTGRQGHNTPAGAFAILQKRQWHRSNLYSNAPMPFMQRLTWTGIALHAGRLPGWPASHGCIRLPMAFAKLLFTATRIGDQVVVSADDRHAPMPQQQPPAPAPVVPTFVAGDAVPPPAPRPGFQRAPVVMAAAYAPGPRLTMDDAVLRGSSLSEDDVAGGVHWGVRGRR